MPAHRLFMPKFLIDRFVGQKQTWVEKDSKNWLSLFNQKSNTSAKLSSRNILNRKSKKYSAQMKLNPSGLRYTHVRTYWGTCAPSGVLSFNLALRFTPPDAVSYVVVHELAHLHWKGHGKRFWAMVEKYYPKTKEMREILRSIPRST